LTPNLDPELLGFFLSQGEAALSRSVGLILLAVLITALTARVLLQAAGPLPQRASLRLLGVVTVPLVMVFVLIVIERFRALA
jgi:hypothetical protein